MLLKYPQVWTGLRLQAGLLCIECQGLPLTSACVLCRCRAWVRGRPRRCSRGSATRAAAAASMPAAAAASVSPSMRRAGPNCRRSQQGRPSLWPLQQQRQGWEQVQWRLQRHLKQQQRQQQQLRQQSSRCQWWQHSRPLLLRAPSSDKVKHGQLQTACVHPPQLVEPLQIGLSQHSPRSTLLRRQRQLRQVRRRHRSMHLQQQRHPVRRRRLNLSQLQRRRRRRRRQQTRLPQWWPWSEMWTC